MFMGYCLSAEKVRARKEYLCVTCDRPILKGELHLVTTDIDCSEFIHSRTHLIEDCEMCEWDEDGNPILGYWRGQDAG